MVKSAVTFVSQASLDAGIGERYGLSKTLLPVKNTRGGISKASMIHNGATPKIEVDPGDLRGAGGWRAADLQAGREPADGAAVFSVLALGASPGPSRGHLVRIFRAQRMAIRRLDGGAGMSAPREGRHLGNDVSKRSKGLGSSDRRGTDSQLVRLEPHYLKWRFQAEMRCSSWRESIAMRSSRSPCSSSIAVAGTIRAQWSEYYGQASDLRKTRRRLRDKESRTRRLSRSTRSGRRILASEPPCSTPIPSSPPPRSSQGHRRQCRADLRGSPAPAWRHQHRRRAGGSGRPPRGAGARRMAMPISWRMAALSRSWPRPSPCSR